MGACHFVAMVEDKFIGDPLDIEMFKSTNWVIDETEETNQATDEFSLSSYYPKEINEVKNSGENRPFYQLGIIKRFDFSPKLQCMSVISKNPFDDSLVGFVKGSPERIQSIAIKNSIPDHYNSILQNYTQDGLRVLACAYKYLPNVSYQNAKAMERQEVE